MSLRSALLLGALVLVPSLADGQAATVSAAHPLPLKRRAQPTVPGITASDLMSRLYVFADDSMMGREAGTPGAMKGTAYIAGELRRLGLKPAGDNGTYFQNVPFIARALDSTTTIAVNGATLTAYKDFVVVPFRGAQPRAIDGAQVVYGGVMGDTAHRLTAEQAEGKFVVMQNPTGALGRIAPTSPLARAAGVGLVGAGDLTDAALATGRAPTQKQPPAPRPPTPRVYFAAIFAAICAVCRP